MHKNRNQKALDIRVKRQLITLIMSAIIQSSNETQAQHKHSTGGNEHERIRIIVSAKYCYATHELRLHQNDRCKRFTLF